MRFTAVAVAAGLLLGLLAGGRPSGLGRTALRWWPALLASMAAQAIPAVANLAPAAAWMALTISYAGLGAFAVANLRIRGMPVVLVGLLLNAAVIAVNGGMPVRAEAMRAAGLEATADIASIDFGSKHHLETDDDRLTVLADIIPVRLLREVLSFGDLILAMGVGDVVFRLLRRPRPSTPGAFVASRLRWHHQSQQALYEHVHQTALLHLHNRIEGQPAGARRQSNPSGAKRHPPTSGGEDASQRGCCS